jgi:hypothetical protein
VAEEVVVVVFERAVMVGCVGRDGVDGKITLDVVHDIWWVINLADAWSRSGAEVGGCDCDCRLRTSEGGFRGILGTGRCRGGGCLGSVGLFEAFWIVVDDIEVSLARKREWRMDRVER